jgi:hypothetical protein
MLEKDEELANFAVYKNSNKGTGKIGVYTKDERLNKILKYKNKIRKWRTQHPVNRNFRGRSQVAGKKPRIKGKFVSIEEYSAYLQSQKPGSVHNESSSYITENSDFSSDFSIKEEAK